MSTTTTPLQDPAPKRRDRRRWPRRLAVMLCVVVVVFGAVLGGLSWAMGRSFTAPDWMRDEITARLSARSEGLAVAIGRVEARVDEGWKPRISLRDVDVTAASGQPIVSLARVEGDIAMAPLFRGRLEPSGVLVSGTTLRLRRLADGSVDLALGDALTSVGQAPSLRALIKGLDAVLERPGLAGLRRIEADAITLRYEDERLGLGWTVDGGRLRLDRDGDALRLAADLALLAGGDSVSTLAFSYESRIGAVASQFAVSFEELTTQDIALQSPALAWLGAVRAPITGAMRVAVDEAGALGPLSATLQIEAGVLQPAAQIEPIPFDGARAYMTYAPDSQSIRFDDLSVSSRWISARAEGTAHLLDMVDGLPRAFLGQFSLTDLGLNPAGMYPEPVRFEAAQVDLRLGLAPFALEVGQASVQDQGRTVLASGRLRATEQGWTYSIGATMAEVPHDRVMALWPVSAIPNTRDWVARNLRQATLTEVQFALQKSPGERPRPYVGFAYRDAVLTFLEGFPPLEEARGLASLEGNRFAVRADRGRLRASQGGPVDVSGTELVVPDVRQPDVPAQVTLRSSGTISATLALLDLPPFGYVSQAGLPVALADGRATGEAVLDLVLGRPLTPEDVKVQARATLRNLRSEVLVPGRVLAAPEMTVTLADQRLSIGGRGRLGPVPFDAVWSTSTARGSTGAELTGTVELSQDFADAFRIGLPPGSLAGSAPSEIRLRFQRGQDTTFRLTSRLLGLRMSLDALGWNKAARLAGRLEVSGALADPVRVDRLELVAPGLSAEGKVRLTSSGQLDRASFNRVRAGGWLDAPVELVGRGGNRPPEVRVTGGSIDLRQTSVAGSGNGGGAQAGPLSLALDRLQISEGIALTRLRGNFDLRRGMDGSFTALVNGSAPVRGQVVPQGGRSAFRITSDDAGAVFSAAGLLKKAHKGTLDLSLAPAGGAGSYDGSLLVRQVWLREAPAMAALLNAVSVVGLLEQLGGTGILFNEVDAKFRLTPRDVTVTRSSATGASIGISMDGRYDLGSGALDMQGVFSPIFMVNGIGSVLTRKGEGLIGFNYRLTGQADTPRVQVNPLSLLTPGMFREIFRRPPPRVTE